MREKLVRRFRELGYESFLYLMGRKTLLHYDEKTEWDDHFRNLVAVSLRSLPRLTGIARLL